MFEALASAILSSELKPGDALPPQRELAQRFGLSTLVIRQAIHRLEDLSLVRVRQGGATIVLDPNTATDARLIELRMQLAPASKALGYDTLEIRMFFMLQMLVLAERRITPKQIGVLSYLIDTLPAEPTLEDTRHFRMELWRTIALATRNPLIEQQMRWWRARAMDPSSINHGFGALPSQPIQRELYRNLVNALESHSGAVALYLRSLEPLMTWLEDQRAKLDSP